jgi:hypothetical protein
MWRYLGEVAIAVSGAAALTAELAALTWRSSTRWQNIHAAPGFNCTDADMPLNLSLIYTD